MVARPRPGSVSHEALPMRRLAPVIIGPLACVLGACAVGPDYRPPASVGPDGWSSPAPPAPQAQSSAASLAAWWTTLDDPLLNEFIDQALAQNKTVKQAMARVAEARARRGVSAAGFWPSIGASAGASRSGGQTRIADDFQSDVSAERRELYNAGLDASWELDLFGGQRRALEASTAQLGASEADLRDVLITLLGDVALNYTSVRT